MLHLKFINYLYISCFLINFAQSEDTYGIINSKRAINIVDEKFLSISVDPAILLSGVTISSTTQHLVSLLSPAYFRLAGPSTAYLDFDLDDSHATTRITQATDRLIVTPASLASVNRWLASANVTPVLGLNDWKRAPSSAKWDTQQVVDMLKQVERDGSVGECYWQLGYDNSNKSLDFYKEDIDVLQNILDGFPEHAEAWKILGSDFTNCLGDDKFNMGAMRNKLNGVDGIIWEKNNKEFDDHFAEHSIKSIMHETSIWTVAPKTNTPISFESAILWATQIGEAANDGFKVIFRQPRIHEFFTDTPPFWVSYFHKKFMGRNVLDIRMLDDDNKNVSVFAHCSKRQNHFPKAGAITIFIINKSTEKEVVNLKISGVIPNNKLTYEVQSYVMEASEEDQSNLLLNGNKINMNEIENINSFLPKLRRARLNKNLNFIVPAKSIGFYLLPGARLPVCISDEDEDDLILKEIIADQQIKFSDEQDDMQIKPRAVERKANLNDLYQMVEKELETDEKYYKKQAGLNEKPTFADKLKELKHKKATEDNSKLVLDIPNILEVKTVEQRVQDLRDKIKEKIEAKKIKSNLDLTNNEMVKVLKERAVSKIEKSKSLTESDIEDFIHKAINLKSRQKRNVKLGPNRIPSKAFGRAHHGPIKHKNRNTLNIHHQGQINHNPLNHNRNILRRPRRDINFDVLKPKTICTTCNNKLDKTSTKSRKALFENNGEIEATFRQPGQTSLELLADSLEDEEDDEEEKIPSEVFAELAKPEKTEQSDELSNFFTKNDEAKKHSFTWDDSMLKPKPKVDFSRLFQLSKLKPIAYNKPSSEIEPRIIKNNDNDLDKHIDELDSFESNEDGLTNYHGFFEELGDAIAFENRKNIDKQNEYYKYVAEIDEEAKTLKQKLNNLNKLLQINQRSDDDIYLDDSFRRKREVKQYTEDDITFYKKLMQSNIKHMREQMARSRMRNGMDNLNTGFPHKFFQARSGDVDKEIKSRSGVSKNDKLEDMKIENQKKMLKVRLNNRKKLEEKRFQSKNVESILSKLKSKSKDNKDIINTTNKNRRKRFSIDNMITKDFDKVHNPNVQLENIIQAYEPLLQNIMKYLSPEIRNYKKIIIERNDDINVDDHQKSIPIPIFVQEVIETSLPKTKRYVGEDDEFDVLQDINNIFSIVGNDGGFIKPFLDEESGEYNIVFPTNDEIKLVKSQGFAELKFIHQTTTEKSSTENPFDKLTCTANYPGKKDIVMPSSVSTELSTKPDLENESINLNLVDYDELPSTEFINIYIGDEKNEKSPISTNSPDVTTYSSTEVEVDKIKINSGITEISNIQHIKTEKDNDTCSKIDMIQKLFSQFKNLVDTIGSTVQKYVHIFQEGEPEVTKNQTVIKN